MLPLLDERQLEVMEEVARKALLLEAKLELRDSLRIPADR